MESKVLKDREDWSPLESLIYEVVVASLHWMFSGTTELRPSMLNPFCELLSGDLFMDLLCAKLRELAFSVVCGILT